MALSKVVAVVAALVALGGCGGDDDDDAGNEFEAGVKEQSADIRQIGEDVGAALTAARGKTDVELAQQFGELADRTEEVIDELGKLDPPEDLEDEVEALSSALGEAEQDLRDIVTAANGADAEAAAKASRELAQDSPAIRRARTALDAAVE